MRKILNNNKIMNTYTGGAIRLILMGISGVPTVMPAVRASFTASIPEDIILNGDW